jgi:hypothetical protein
VAPQPLREALGSVLDVLTVEPVTGGPKNRKFERNLSHFQGWSSEDRKELGKEHARSMSFGLSADGRNV